MAAEKFPLQWPVGYKRNNYGRYSSKFKNTPFKAFLFLKDEVRKMGGTDLIISTNCRVRLDGDIYADELNKNIPDPGVAIYFKWNRKEIVMCCDKYKMVWENVLALGKGIEALRGLERWGVSEFMERAFTGFNALPPVGGTSKPAKREWWVVFGYAQRPGNASWDWAGVQAQYKSLAKEHHPDAPGGNTALFQELNNAYDEAKKHYGQ